MKIAVVPASYGSLGKNKGCELAPALLTKGLGAKIFEIIGENLEDLGEKLLNFVNSSNDKLFLVGGDHSITYFSFKGFSDGNSGLIVFDAHPDMQSSDFITHEDYLRILIEEGILKSENIVIVGLRSISFEEQDYLIRKKIVYFDMNKIFELGIEEVCNLVMERMNKFSRLYLSIDIDAADPAFAPGTGYLEPGGLSSFELLYMVKRIRMMKNLKVVDLVEINPNKDLNGITVALGRKILEAFL